MATPDWTQRVMDLEVRVHAIEDAIEAGADETIGMPVRRVADRLKRGTKRTAAAVAKASKIVSVAEGGPPDLAANCRKYLHGEAE